MGTTTLRAPLTVDEYLDEHWDPAPELIRGDLRPKPIATYDHSVVQARLVSRLFALFGSRTATELSIRNGSSVLIPDICVLNSENPSLYRNILDEAPLLCVEILPPSQTPGELFLKCETYHEWGVRFCWMIDPAGKRAWVYHKGDSAPREVQTELTGPLNLSLSDLFLARSL